MQQTTYLKLNVPEFDFQPWDGEINDNWAILDAAMSQLIGIPGLAGVWKNSTHYLQGQAVIDALDSAVWSCSQTHTSSDPPTTFPQERVAYPARWGVQAPGAAYWAQQAVTAANTATAAAASASASEAVVHGALPITGGTMTGALTLFGDPTGVLDAATKQYVDARVGGTGYLPTTGGALSGYLTVPGIYYSNIAAADQHAMSFGWNGSVYMTVDGSYVGTVATQDHVYNSYLPLGGGTLTGYLYVPGIIHTTTNGYWTADSGYTYFSLTADGWRFQFGRQTGNLTWQNPQGTPFLTIQGGGAAYFYSYLQAPTIVAVGGLYARGGTVYIGSQDRTHIASDNSSYTDFSFADNYRFNFNWSNGVLAWFNWNNTVLFTLDGAGSGVFQGNLNAAGTIGASGSINANVNISANGDINGNAIIGRSQIISYGPVWVNNDGNFGLVADGSYYYMRYNPTPFEWRWARNGGDLIWVSGGSGGFFHINNANGQCVDYLGPFAGNGGYIDFSDERLKENIEYAEIGLEQIKMLEPITFNRTTRVDGDRLRELGFTAQNVMRAIPEAVQMTTAQDGSEIMGVVGNAILAAVVNGMKTLDVRLSAQERRQ